MLKSFTFLALTEFIKHISKLVMLNLLGIYEKDPYRADMKYHFLRNPELSDEPEKYEAAAERLRRLAALEEEKNLAELPASVHTFSENEFPGYKKSHVIFLTHPNTLAQRFQRSGLCSMNAPIITQYYREVLSHGTNQYPMLDLLKFLREKLEPEELADYIFKHEGFDSHEFLQKIIGKDSHTLESGFADIIENFKKYGPALVQKFEVREDFYNQSIRHHYGKYHSEDIVGYHAMVLVGYRFDNESEKNFFLLQNWWKEKQFVEVDEDYFKKHAGGIYFIVTPQSEVIDVVPTTYEFGRFRNVEGIDKPEGKPHEKSPQNE